MRCTEFIKYHVTDPQRYVLSVRNGGDTYYLVALFLFKILLFKFIIINAKKRSFWKYIILLLKYRFFWSQNEP